MYSVQFLRLCLMLHSNSILSLTFINIQKKTASENEQQNQQQTKTKGEQTTTKGVTITKKIGSKGVGRGWVGDGGIGGR